MYVVGVTQEDDMQVNMGGGGVGALGGFVQAAMKTDGGGHAVGRAPTHTDTCIFHAHILVLSLATAGTIACTLAGGPDP